MEHKVTLQLVSPFELLVALRTWKGIHICVSNPHMISVQFVLFEGFATGCTNSHCRFHQIMSTNVRVTGKASLEVFVANGTRVLRRTVGQNVMYHRIPHFESLATHIARIQGIRVVDFIMRVESVLGFEVPICV